MARTVASFLEEVADDLMDASTTRWSARELVRYTNAGQQVIAAARREDFAKTVNHALVAGVRQTLPADAMSLIDIPANVGGDAAPVRWIDRGLLDRFDPLWRSADPVDAVTGFSYDARDPLVFTVTPPASGAAVVSLVYAAMPAAIDLPAVGAPLSSVSGSLAVRDYLVPALRAIVLARAFARDSEDASNAARASAAASEAAGILGIDKAAVLGTAPVTLKDSATRRASG